MISEQGAFKLTHDEYHADPCPVPSMSRGTVVDILSSPAKAFWNHPRLNKELKDDRDESKFNQGSAAHNLLLEGGSRIAVISGFDDWKKQAGRDARDDAMNNGMIPLLEKTFDSLCLMVGSAKVQIAASELGLSDLPGTGQAEMTYIAKDGETWERCMVDWISNDGGLILDYKTTGTSAHPSKFSRHISDMQYPIQHVWYRRVVQMATGIAPRFVWIAQEDEPPYLCSFMGIDPMNEAIAQEKVEWAVRLWRKSMEYNEWPGYPRRICYAEPKPWELTEWEEKKAAYKTIYGEQGQETKIPF